MTRLCKNCRWSNSLGEPNGFGYEHDGQCDDCSLDPHPARKTNNWEARFIKCEDCDFWTGRDGDPICTQYSEEKGATDTCESFNICYQKLPAPAKEKPATKREKGGDDGKV